MNSSMSLFVLVIGLALCIAQAHAGSLSEFEIDASSDKESSDSRTSNTTDENSSGKRGFFEDLIIDILLFPFRFGGSYSMLRVSASNDLVYGGFDFTSDDANIGDLKRIKGESLIPFFRNDVFVHGHDSHVYSANVRMEAGYGAYGLELRHTVLQEQNSTDSLTISTGNFLYRMSFGDYVEIDVGVGVGYFEGQRSYNGMSLTIPILFHPNRTYGFEYRPSWFSGDKIGFQDHMLGLHYGKQFFSAIAGYRWLNTTHVSLSGPLIGFAIKW